MVKGFAETQFQVYCKVLHELPPTLIRPKQHRSTQRDLPSSVLSSAVSLKSMHDH